MRTCRMGPRVDAHFALALPVGEERELRVHLEGCAACRARYRRHLLLAKLDPEAVPAEERIGRALGLGSPPVSRPRRLWLAPAAALIVAAAILLLVVHRPAAPEGAFTPRGAALDARAPSPVRVYRVDPRGGVVAPLVDGTVHRGDELAFAYENAEGRPFLMIFAVDEHGRVTWFHPGWTDADATPSASAIERTPGLHELPEAILHRYEGVTTITLHALYMNASRNVREVEAALASQRDPSRPLELLGAVDYVQQLSVTP